MLNILTILYLQCVNVTIPNPFTIHNLPTEQCIVLYSYASDKCYLNMQGMAEMCEVEETMCSRDSFDKIIDLNEVCRGEEPIKI